jgi:hypothetical protein
MFYYKYTNKDMGKSIARFIHDATRKDTKLIRHSWKKVLILVLLVYFKMWQKLLNSCINRDEILYKSYLYSGEIMHEISKLQLEKFKNLKLHLSVLLIFIPGTGAAIDAAAVVSVSSLCCIHSAFLIHCVYACHIFLS